MSNNRHTLFDSGLALAAVTAYLYCASAAHTGGFNNRLRLDADVLDRNSQQILYDGFVISIGPAIIVLIVYAALRYAYSNAILPGLNDALRANWRRKRRFLKWKKKIYGTRKDSELERSAKRHTRVAFATTVAAIVLIASLAHFESKGYEVADKLLTKLENKSFLQHEFVEVTANGKALKLLYLSCGTRNCSGVDPETLVVHYFPQTGHSFVLPFARAKESMTNINTPK